MSFRPKKYRTTLSPRATLQSDRRNLLQTLDFSLELFEERRARSCQLLSQPFSAITIPTRPGFGAVLIAAAATVVSILNLCQFEMLFPVRTFFLKGSRAIAHFNPASGPVGAKPRVLH